MKYWVQENSKTLAAPTTARGSNVYLGSNDFHMMLLAALVLHIAILVIYLVIPKEDTLLVPVRVLNIKLGAGGNSTIKADPRQVKKVTPPTPTPAPEPVVKKEPLIASKVAPKRAAAPAKKKVASAPAKKAPKKIKIPNEVATKAVPKLPERKTPTRNPYAIDQIPTQYVRESTLKAPGTAVNKSAAAGAKSGQSTEQIRARYEQLISGWLQKHKIYPLQAQQQGIEGEGVVRIRIDRRGKITYYALEKKTGYDLLDRAIMSMVKRANPVPPVPLNYPSGQLLEFLIPVRFNV